MKTVYVKLVRVDTKDQEDFADLIGQTGTLRFCSDGIIFHDLDILIKGEPKEDDDKIIIKSKLGNVFTFKRVKAP